MDISNKKLTVSVKVQLEDLKSFNLRVHRKKTLTMMPLYLAFIFIILFFANIVGISDKPTRAIVSLIISAIVSVMFVFILLISINTKTKKLFQMDETLRKGQTLTIDTEGIHSKSYQGEGEIKWSQVFKVERSQKGIYIFISKDEAIIIPIRDLKGNNDLDLLNSIIDASYKK